MIEPQSDDKACPIPEPLKVHIQSLFFLASLFLLSFMCRFTFAPLMPAIERDLHLNHTRAGSIFLMMSLGFSIGQVCSGLLTSRLNHRGSLALSGVGAGLALLPLIFHPTMGQMTILLFLLGSFAGLHLPSAIATITAMVSKQDWGKALGLHQTAPSLALVLAPFLSVGLLGILSWSMIMTGLGAFSIIAALAFILYCRCGAFPGEAPRPVVVRSIMALPSFWVMVFLFAMAMGCSVGIYTMLPLYLVHERGFDTGWANSLLGLSRIPGLFMSFVAGWLTDRLGEKRSVTGVLFASGLATVLLGLSEGHWLITMIFLQPALIVCFFPPAFAALSRIVPPHLRSVAISLTTPLAFLVGGGVVPTFLGYMGEVRTFSLGIILTGCITLLAPVLALSLKLRLKNEEGC